MKGKDRKQNQRPYRAPAARTRLVYPTRAEGGTKASPNSPTRATSPVQDRNPAPPPLRHRHAPRRTHLPHPPIPRAASSTGRPPQHIPFLRFRKVPLRPSPPQTRASGSSRRLSLSTKARVCGMPLPSDSPLAPPRASPCHTPSAPRVPRETPAPSASAPIPHLTAGGVACLSCAMLRGRGL